MRYLVFWVVYNVFVGGSMARHVVRMAPYDRPYEALIIQNLVTETNRKVSTVQKGGESGLQGTASFTAF